MIIKDIKFMNGEGYLLKNLSFSLCECEDQMKQIDYDQFYDAYRSHRDETGVEKTQFPPIIYAFYSIVFNYCKVPTPIELLDEYYLINATELLVDGETIILVICTIISSSSMGASSATHFAPIIKSGEWSFWSSSHGKLS